MHFHLDFFSPGGGSMSLKDKKDNVTEGKVITGKVLSKTPEVSVLCLRFSISEWILLFPKLSHVKIYFYKNAQ